MIEFLSQPWHWSITGILIGLTVPVLLIFDNKKFGISANLRHACAICFPAKIPFFNYDWKSEKWNLFFVFGILIGGFIAYEFIPNENPIHLAEHTKHVMESYGITDFSNIQPNEVFSWNTLFTMRGFVFFIVGGFLVGFGTRYAGGCTSGHSIMGIASLQLPSLVATCCFMVGGFISANYIIPIIFKYL
ncbi:MAG: YeeE/YedE family protein [Flavobacteriales bacterium]|nr:YeeE/YedE family protein [Flavobacteriales bacterium]